MTSSKGYPGSFGPVLVTGGCGFLGWHLVGALLNDPAFNPVHVVDRSIEHNVHAAAHYTRGDITDLAAMKALLADTSPRIVFHAASPSATFPTHGKRDFYTTNVTGTENLLTLARANPATEAFVFTSSSDAYADPPHANVAEDHPLWHARSPASDEYSRTKGMADALVLAADGPDLKTVSMRVVHMYGERSSQELPVLLSMANDWLPLMQFGEGKNMVEVVSGGNAAAAHVVAARALMEPKQAKGKVAGEAFNVSDGAPVLFWGQHMLTTWNVARGRDVKDELWRVPVWVAVLVFTLVHWAYWLFTFGMVEPPGNLGKTALLYTTRTHTYSSEKARRVLGFNPPQDHEGEIRRSVTWAKRQEAEKHAKQAKRA